MMKYSEVIFKGLDTTFKPQAKSRVPRPYVAHAREGLERIKLILLGDRKIRRFIYYAKVERVPTGRLRRPRRVYVLRLKFRYKKLEFVEEIYWWGAQSRIFAPSDYEKRRDVLLSLSSLYSCLVSTGWLHPLVRRALRRRGVHVVVLNHNFFPWGLTREKIDEIQARAEKRFREGHKRWVERFPEIPKKHIPCLPPLMVSRPAFDQVLMKKLKSLVNLIFNLIAKFYPEVREWWRRYARALKGLMEAIRVGSRDLERYYRRRLDLLASGTLDKPPPGPEPGARTHTTI